MPLNRMTDLWKIYRILQSLSFDVCIGAVAGGIFALHVTQGKLNPIYYLILFLAVFFIYTLDHLFDAKMIGATAARFRYRFHYSHYRIILFFTINAGLIALVLSLIYMPKEVIYGGLLVFLGVVVHLLLAQYTNSIPFMKEISVAIYYTIGIWMAPVIESKNANTITLSLNIILFFFSVLISLFVFSWMEIEADKKDGSHSIAVHLGKKKTEILINFVFILGYSLMVFFVYLDIVNHFLKYYWLPQFVIFTIHLVIYKYPKFFLKKDLFRMLGDGFFIIYGIVYFLK